jgi:hypothetical protein
MMASGDNEKIKVFVRNTLGCDCPEKVFEKIDVSKLPIAAYEKEATRIVVGDRLLIYIIHPEPSANVVDSVEEISLAGKVDRDTNNYNRFRLVVAGFEDDEQQEKVLGCFSKSFDNDEKMHIHFVNQEMIEGCVF